jgi:hypothetical protein
LFLSRPNTCEIYRILELVDTLETIVNQFNDPSGPVLLEGNNMAIVGKSNVDQRLKFCVFDSDGFFVEPWYKRNVFEATLL